MQLTQSLKHWGTSSFDQILKAELENLPADTLPLYQATTQGGIVDSSNISASILSSHANENEIHIRTGIFFSEIVAGCNCNDPPMEINGYCLLGVFIDRRSGETSFAIIPD